MQANAAMLEGKNLINLKQMTKFSEASRSLASESRKREHALVQSDSPDHGGKVSKMGPG